MYLSCSLDLIDLPRNPLISKLMERTAAAYSSIVIINQLFIAFNDLIELEWLEREYANTGKTKWDGMLFKTGDHSTSPGFIEFSGGANGASSPGKEKRDVIKLYKKMKDILAAYPINSNKKIFCMRYYDNEIYFEKLYELNGKVYKTEVARITVPTTTRLLLKFIEEIPKILSWRNEIVKHVEQF